MRTNELCCALALAVALFACQKSDMQRPGVTNITSGAPLARMTGPGQEDLSLGGEQAGATGAPGATVVERIARARCDRETYCSRVGPDQPVSTDRQCMASEHDRAYGDVASAQCDLGFDEMQLAICLNSIRQAACETSLDSIASLEPCQSATLCAQ